MILIKVICTISLQINCKEKKYDLNYFNECVNSMQNQLQNFIIKITDLQSKCKKEFLDELSQIKYLTTPESITLYTNMLLLISVSGSASDIVFSKRSMYIKMAAVNSTS